MPPRSSSSDAEEYYLDIKHHKEPMAKWLDSERPTLTDAQVKAICQKVTPQVNQQITASLKWSQSDIDILNRAACQASDAQHEDTVLDLGEETGPKLYKLCLRLWRMFPTEIICPGTGLVFGGNTEDHIQPKLIEMKWTRSFNEALSKILVHSAWGDEFYLMVSAIKFLCICASDDRRPWKLDASDNPFFEAFLHCQEQKPDAPKKDLLDAVEERLDNQGDLPSTTLAIFQSIASTVASSPRQDINEDYDDGLRNRPDPEPWHLLTVRTRHLALLADALDKTNVRGMPLFCPAKAQLSLVTSALADGGRYAKDAPTNKSDYKWLRKVALKGLRASGIAYKMAWDTEMTVFRDIPRYLRPVPNTDDTDEDEEEGGNVVEVPPPTFPPILPSTFTTSAASTIGEEMTDFTLSTDKPVQKDDLRLIYEHKSLKLALCTLWPTKGNWEHIQDGKHVSVGLHGIAAAIMFLRRMYAFLGGKDLSGGKPTILTQLSWRDVPLSDETKPEVLQALFQELGISSEGKGPSLLEILHHDSMKDIWDTASMSLFSTKCIMQKVGQDPKVDKSPPHPQGAWKREIIRLGPTRVLEDKLGNLFSQKKHEDKFIQPLCNFPPFIKAHYRISEADSRSFSNIRTFRFRAMTLADETNAVEEEHIYVLIACYFNPDEKNEFGELRLYYEGGMPIIPRNGFPREWQHVGDAASRKRIGQPGQDFVALYGKTDNDEEEPYCSEFPPFVLQDGSLHRKSVREFMQRSMAQPSASSPSTVVKEGLEKTSEAPHVQEAASQQSTSHATSKQRSAPGTVSGMSDSYSMHNQDEYETSQLPKGHRPTQRSDRKRPYSGSHYGATSGYGPGSRQPSSREKRPRQGPSIGLSRAE
ncbi:hypothetical protein F4679DRAFT_599081 [Xylaria curta]|nr:hypothetical protein F4679DRAFT_599081 [Xylaria curta]